jgi:non-ribosomal peptide synthetase component F
MINRDLGNVMNRIEPTGKYDLPATVANNVPLSPLSFLARTAAIFPDHLALMNGGVRLTWRQVEQRCRRLASTLFARGVGCGGTVAVMPPNVPAMFDAHFGVAMAGGVLNALNYRLDAPSIAFILEHGEAKVLIPDREFASTIAATLALMVPERRPFVLVPASSFCEYLPGKPAVPSWFALGEDRPLFAFGGLWRLGRHPRQG